MTIDFRSKQSEFSAYIRDPDNNPAPDDVGLARMMMYRTLFFNNIENLLSANFPVLRAIHDDKTWPALVQDFYASHHSKTPYFSEIAEEFLDYLQNERNHPGDFPFMLELAHYEWVEMALANAKEELFVNESVIDDFIQKSISLSPLAWPLIYRYPVHRLSPGYLPLDPPARPSCLIAYRNQDDDVNFIEITPTTCHLLQLLEENGSVSAETCLNRMIRDLHHCDPEIVRQEGLKILKELSEKNIIMVLD
ncbi:MAG: HvfC family RiPP maturation protein [Gammaproteobacteria bacterium]